MSRILIHSLYEDQSSIVPTAFLCCYVWYNLPHSHLLTPPNAAMLSATTRWRCLHSVAGEVGPLEFVSEMKCCASSGEHLSGKPGQGRACPVPLPGQTEKWTRKNLKLGVAKAIKQINPSETCCFKRSPTQWCTVWWTTFNPKRGGFIAPNLTDWLVDTRRSVTGLRVWGQCARGSPINTEIHPTGKKVHIAPTTDSGSLWVWVLIPLPANQQKLMCPPPPSPLPPRHSPHHSSLLYLVDLCRSPFFLLLFLL